MILRRLRLTSHVISSWLAIVMPEDEAQPPNAVIIIGRIEPFEDTVMKEYVRPGEKRS